MTALGAVAASPVHADQFRLKGVGACVAPHCQDCWETYSYPCPQPQTLLVPEAREDSEEAVLPPDQQAATVQAPSAAPSSSFSSLSGATGTPTAPASAVPNMIGDTLGGACGTAFFAGFVEGEVNHPNFSSCSRQKIAENNSPMPRNRAYFNYTHFHNAIHNFTTDDDGQMLLRSDTDTNVDRYTVGFEKTFLYDVFSLEVRLPAVDQLGTELFYDFRTPPAAPSGRDLQLGNVTLALKALLYTNASGLALSGGLLLESPTSEDVRIRSLDVFFEAVDPDPADDQVMSDYRFHFENDSTFLSPFLAFLYQPDAPYFVQGFWQVDTPVHGADLAFDLRDTVDGATARLQDKVHFTGETSMRFDLGGGVYLYRDQTGRGWLSDLAFLVELHYSTTLEDSDLYSVDTPAFGNAVTPGVIDGAEIVLGNASNRVDILNLTFGPTAILRNGTSIATGFVVPTDTGEEKPFDFEFQLQVNRYF
jgi:hypothetical protein